MEKKCIRCDHLKPINDYYKHDRMKDGHLGKCKNCCKVESVINREKNLERIQEYDRKRGSRQAPGYLKKYRKDNPEIYSAQSKLGNAVRDGKIEKPDVCCECGKVKRLVGHHRDYSKPFEVDWMCQSCHKRWHRDFDL